MLPGMPNMLLLIHQHAKTYNNIRVQQQRDSPDAITALLLFGSETDGRMVMGGGRQRDLFFDLSFFLRRTNQTMNSIIFEPHSLSRSPLDSDCYHLPRTLSSFSGVDGDIPHGIRLHPLVFFPRFSYDYPHGDCVSHNFPCRFIKRVDCQPSGEWHSD